MSKMEPFSLFGPQSSKKGARNHLFHKPFGPGRKMGAKMRFWVQKSDFGGQNAILSSKSPKNAFLDPKITFWGRLRALAQKAYETNGFGAPFSPFWSKNGENGSFFHFWAPKRKNKLFFHFWSQKCKNELIFGFWLPKSLKRLLKPFVS